MISDQCIGRMRFRSAVSTMMLLFAWIPVSSAQGLASQLPAGTPGGRSPQATSQFELVEPTGIVSGRARITQGSLIATDAGGVRYVFLRDRQFDSFDGRFVGYWNPSLNNVVRFPRSGRGLMQLADLDAVYPRFAFSRRRVRPIGRPPGRFVIGQSPWLVPTYGSYPFGYPFFGYGYQSFGVGLTAGVPLPGVAGFGPIRSRYRAAYAPRSITLESSVVPRPPLEPVDVLLRNSAAREIRVTIADRKNPQSKMVRIAPGAAKQVTFQRDAGADWVRVIQTLALDGSIVTREVSTPVAPEPRYELVVHEWTLQSVAIDRTGKSPNVIEDVQFQGKGLGRFQLPPGAGLQSGVLDVVQTARASGNAGSVSPMIDDSGRTLNSPRPSRPVSSLEQMILEQQRRASGQR